MVAPAPLHTHFCEHAYGPLTYAYVDGKFGRTDPQNDKQTLQYHALALALALALTLTLDLITLAPLFPFHRFTFMLFCTINI